MDAFESKDRANDHEQSKIVNTKQSDNRLCHASQPKKLTKQERYYQKNREHMLEKFKEAYAKKK